MKKIPTCFERKFDGNRIIDVLPDFHCSICKDAFENGIATLKLDGSACMITSGEIYKRFDYKPGRKLPAGAIPCQEKPDSITGHFPHWVKCERINAADIHFFEAFDNYSKTNALRHSGDSFEAIGKHFNGNPYHLSNNILVPHGKICLDVPRTFDGIKKFLQENYIEGIVFWRDGNPVCKIKRSDFGLSWGKNKSIVTGFYDICPGGKVVSCDNIMCGGCEK